MDKTRSNLISAIIRSDEKKFPGDPVIIPCTFNPYEYTITKTNKFKEVPPEDNKKGEKPSINFEKQAPQILKLKLIFDTYEDDGNLIEDYIKPLWRLMASEVPEDGNTKKRPPHVVFEWGPFSFRSYITKMQQKFVLFDQVGRPLRAKVDVTFTQYGIEDTEDYRDKYPMQNPTSGGGDIIQIWTVKGGERLENIAYEVYGESSAWRKIAYYNDISNPSGLLPGSRLMIPNL